MINEFNEVEGLIFSLFPASLVAFMLGLVVFKDFGETPLEVALLSGFFVLGMINLILIFISVKVLIKDRRKRNDKLDV